LLVCVDVFLVDLLFYVLFCVILVFDVAMGSVVVFHHLVFVLEFIFVVVEPGARALACRRRIFVFDVFGVFFVAGVGRLDGFGIGFILFLVSGKSCSVELFLAQWLIEQGRLRRFHADFVVTGGKHAQARAAAHLTFGYGQLAAGNTKAGLAVGTLGEQGRSHDVTTCRRRGDETRCEW
jgi:hypothetical protein